MAVSAIQTLLKRFEVTVLKDKSPTDKAQVPVAASVDVHKQGATVKTAITVPWPNPPDDVIVDVYHIGDTVVGDQLALNGNSPAVLTVTSVVSVSQIGVFNLSGQAVSLAVGDRLVITTNRPTIYVDAEGKVPKAAPISTLTSDASTGRAGGYLQFRRFDYVISGGGISPARVFPDADGGLVKDFSTIQAEIDALPPEGGVVFVPPGDYVLAAGESIVLSKAVHLFGSGIAATRIQTSSANDTCIKVQSSGCVIEGLRLAGQPDAGSGVGIDVGSSNQVLENITIRNVRIINFSKYGLRIRGTSDGFQWTNQVLIERVQVQACSQDSSTGAQIHVGKSCTEIKFLGVIVGPSSGSATSPSGVLGWEVINAANIELDSCEAQPASISTSIVRYRISSGGTGADKGAHFTISNCDFESTVASPTGSTFAVWISGARHPVIRSTIFYQLAGGILLDNGCYQPIIEGNLFKVVTPDFHIKLEDATDAVLLNNAQEDADPTATRSPALFSEGSNTKGTVVVQGGVIHLPRYPFASLPPLTTSKILMGAVAYDTTNNKLVVLLSSGTWQPVH